MFCSKWTVIIYYNRLLSSIIENGILRELSQLSNPISLIEMLLPLYLEVNLCPMDHLRVFYYREVRTKVGPI